MDKDIQVLAPTKLVADLNKITGRYAMLQGLFADFATDVTEFFTKNATVDGLVFWPQSASKNQLKAFTVRLVGRELFISFEMANSQGLITIRDITDKDNVKTKVTCVFNGQGDTPLKTEKGDLLSIVGGEGRHLFLHLLHEAIKSAG
jgi:hypothetical protein